MLESLLVSQILLWIIILILGLVCLALARQIGVLYERIAPAGALAINQRLSGGDRAPELTLETLSGQTIIIGVKLDGQQDKQDRSKSQLLFFLSPSCPVCKTLLPVLHSIKQAEKSWLNIVLASDGDSKSKHLTFVEKYELENYPYVLSQSLGLTYGVSKLPYAVLIDEDGLIVSLGIVNSREHLESLFEAKLLGKATIQDYLQSHSDTDESVESQASGY